MNRLEIRVGGEVVGGHMVGGELFIVATRETTAELRRAIRSGARGFYLWPEEHDALHRDLTQAIEWKMRPYSEQMEDLKHMVEGHKEVATHDLTDPALD